MRLTRRQLCVGVGLAAVGSALPASPPQPVQVDIRTFAFKPTQITIKAGQSIEWINHDFAPHTATDDDGDWDTGELGKNDRGTVHFDIPGRYAYFCAYHPHMRGEIVVTST